MKRDSRIFELIEEEAVRQRAGLELIASENYVSDQVLEAAGSICTNKYAEGYPGKRYYGGCQVVDKIEQLAIDRLKEIYGACWANVQPHSGAQANMAVTMAVLKPGDTFMGLDLSQGGHLTHGSPVNASGILYHAVAYGLDPETGRVDYDAMERLALEHKPKLIIGGASAYSREWDYARMRAIADKVGAILWIDMAHTAGLIAAGLLDNPVKYAHIVTSTTHKTLRGPRGGIILMGEDFPDPQGRTTPKGEVKMMSAVLDSSVSSQAAENNHAGYVIHQGEVIDLSKVDVEELRKEIRVAQYRAVEIDDLKEFIEKALHQMLSRNITRQKFSQRFRGIIDRYNAGGTENEEYYKQLLQLIEDLKAEDKRPEAEGLSEEELEIFDLLIAGKKLTKDEEQKVKLSAKNLFKKLTDEKPTLMVVDWYKDEQPRAKVKSAIETSLDADLPLSYDKATFTAKIDLLLTHFIDMAVQGYGWVAA